MHVYIHIDEMFIHRDREVQSAHYVALCCVSCDILDSLSSFSQPASQACEELRVHGADETVDEMLAALPPSLLVVAKSNSSTRNYEMKL